MNSIILFPARSKSDSDYEISFYPWMFGVSFALAIYLLYCSASLETAISLIISYIFLKYV